MTAAVGGAVLCAVSVVGRALSGRWVAPIPTYTATWGVALVGYEIARSLFSPLVMLDEVTVLFYVVAALVFVSGCLAAQLAAFDLRKSPPRYVLRGWVFPAVFLCVLVVAPLAYLRVRELLAGVPLVDLLYYARRLDVQESMIGGPSILGPYANLIPLSLAVTLVAYSVPATPLTRRMRAVFLLITLAAPLLIGGRSAIVGLLVSMIAVTALRGELSARLGVSLAVAFVVCFFGIALLVKKGGTSVDAPLSENARGLVQGLRDYALGGVAAFQRVLQHPGEVPSTMGVTRTFAEIANHLGANISVPPLHAEFSQIGDRSVTNVYTTYASYLDYGLIGAALLAFVFGFVVTTVYRHAIRGHSIATAVYAALFSGMVLSIFSETFYSNVNFLGKLVVCGFVLTRRDTGKVPERPSRLTANPDRRLAGE